MLATLAVASVAMRAISTLVMAEVLGCLFELTLLSFLLMVKRGGMKNPARGHAAVLRVADAQGFGPIGFVALAAGTFRRSRS
jgi:hypothetical protein